MPRIPHEYTVRGESADEEFEWFVRHIRNHGYRADFGGRVYTYLEVHSWKYWTMGVAVEETTIINRVRA